MLNIKKSWVTFLITSLLCLTLSLFAFSIQTLGHRIANQSVVRVFLDDTVSEQGIIEQLNEVEGIIKTNYLSKDEVVTEFEASFGYSWPGTTPLPDLVDIFIVPALSEQVIQDVEGMKGIEYVSYQANVINKLTWLTTFFSWLSGIVFLMAIFMATLSSLFIVRRRKLRCEF